MAVEKAKNVPPFVRFCAASIPTVFDDSMSYYECLCALTKFLQTNVVNVINNNANILSDTVEGLKDLKAYVDNYFANLDVQEEINNKLDEMAEGGQLAGIIAQFLAVAPVFAYHTIAEMAAATNLSNGTIARVIGDTDAADGDGAYYLIRTVEGGDDPDGHDLVAIGATLVGVRVNDGNLDAAVTTLNSSISTLSSEIDKINARKTHNIKFIGNDEPYYPEYELRSTVNGLGFEPIVTRYDSDAEISIQGIAIWQSAGKLVCNNGTEIYTIKQNNNATKTTLWSGDYGHGGDCCIFGNDMFIADSENNSIYKVNLTTGNKTTYNISSDNIKNATENYAPIVAGVCGDSADLLYIVVCDPENNDHTIKANSTVRIYTYDTTSGDTDKIFEMPQDTCYLQGITKDAEFIYVVGNKPFSGNYDGSILTIIDAETLTVYDKISNNSDYEIEGLDYGAYAGMEGLATVCCNYGTRYSFGMYSFYGNQSKQRTLYNTDSIKAYTTKSRDGYVSLFFTIYDDFAAGEGTYTYANLFENAFPIIAGGSSSNFSPIPLSGSTRYFDGFAIWDYNDVKNRLRVFVKTGSQAVTFVNGVISYRSN